MPSELPVVLGSIRYFKWDKSKTRNCQHRAWNYWKNPGEDKASPGPSGWGASTAVRMHCPGTPLEAGTPVKQKADRNHEVALGMEKRDWLEERDRQGVAIPSDVGWGREEAASMTQKFSAIHRKREVGRRSRFRGENDNSCHQTLLKTMVCSVPLQNMLPVPSWSLGNTLVLNAKKIYFKQMFTHYPPGRSFSAS